MNRKLIRSDERISSGSRARRSAMHSDYYAHRSSRDMRVVSTVIGIIAVLLLAQSIFQVPFLRLSNIEIRGLRYLQAAGVENTVRQELSRRRAIIFRNDNYFLFNDATLSARLRSDFFVDVVGIRKQFPRTLIVDVNERIAGFVLKTPENHLAVDTQGAITGVVAGPEPGQGVVVDERSAAGAVIPLNYLEAVTEISELWGENIMQPKILIFHITDDQQIIRVSTDASYQVYFSPEKDIEKQVARLVVFLSDPMLTQPREYLDLRFDDNLYLR